MTRQPRLPGRALPRVLIPLIALFCGGLALMLTWDRSGPWTGTLLASQARAESELVAPAATPAPAEEAPPAEVFEDDPLHTLALSLRERERKLDERDAALKLEERRLEDLRLEVQTSMQELQTVLKRMESLAEQAGAQRQKQMKQWVEIYQKMAPEKVVPLLDTLEPRVQIEVLAQMETSKAAKILNAFPREQAAELSARLND